MKNNNVFKYIFIAFIIILILGTVYILYNQNKKKEEEELEGGNNTLESSVQILDNLTMGISNYDTMNPLLTNNKEIINISKIIFEPLINITSDYKVEMCLAKSCKKINDTKEKT